MYQLFTRLLLREFHNQLGGAWAFVMRDIIFRLLHLVKEVRNMKRYASIMLLLLQVDVIISSPEPKSIVRPFTMLKDLQNCLANQSQISCGASLGRGNESLFAASGSHDQDGRHAHIW